MVSISHTMDPFLSIPLEVRQGILEELPTLRDLQSAALSSRALLDANIASRRFVRSRVFLNQFYELEAEYDPRRRPQSGNPFAVASRWISQLSKKDAYDGLILRDILWPYLLADQESSTRSLSRVTSIKNTEVFCSWAAHLASSCRQFHDEPKARRVDGETLRLVPPNSVCLGEAWLTWLQTTVAASMSQGDYGYAGYICKKMWSRFDLIPDHRHKPGLDGLALVRITSAVCSCADGISMADSMSAYAINRAHSSAWEYLRVQTSGGSTVHQPGMFCYRCLDGAKLLIEGAQHSRGAVEPGLPHLQRLWKSVQPRGMAFNAWSHLFVNSHADRLAGIFKVWTKLQEDRRETFLQDIDLDWARDIICLLRKSGATERSLSFQTEVFDLMSPRDHQYCAFGRNLADAHLKFGRLQDAISVREKVLDELPNVSTVRPSWILALARLYRKTGRDEDAGHLSSLLKVE
ncbi:hypothetical protein KVR01_011780 [Diaporthe batatas]|uniref:uncharacterized protein n=1 Tax=Diaporthe batatas TaxID=748121 RepID=UPI001D056AE2|nr:uncharacterized protein KVR01_011780 [Diaporthe batatas]KAG8158658.1 hypothetical protein KVR01_011780 [Diaporthe batatas]